MIATKGYTQLLGNLDQALAALKRTTGLDGHVLKFEPLQENDLRPDAAITITADGKTHQYLVEAKTRIDRFAALGHLKAQLERFHQPGLIFANYITPALADRCRELDMQFLDDAGNAFLRAPGLYVFVTGQKPTRTAADVRGTGTATAQRVVFALLCEPTLLNAPYREIVDAAGVALGAIGWVFDDLFKRRFITGTKGGTQRHFLQPVQMFEEWVTNYPIKLRPKLNARRFRAENPEWWREARIQDFGGHWGGEVAADRLTGYLRPATQTIYLERKETGDPITKLVGKHRLVADPRGNVEILDAFWKLPANPEQPDIVPPILAYADLAATLDPRNIEVAKLVREKYIDNALRQA